MHTQVVEVIITIKAATPTPAEELASEVVGGKEEEKIEGIFLTRTLKREREKNRVVNCCCYGAKLFPLPSFFSSTTWDREEARPSLTRRGEKGQPASKQPWKLEALY